MPNQNLPDLYKLTGLSPNSNKDEISAAKRRLNKELHPDLMRGAGKTSDEIAKAQDRLKEINAAIDIINDPEKRKEYDKLMREASEPITPEGTQPVRSGHSDSYTTTFNDLFTSFFGDKGGSTWNQNIWGQQQRKEDAHFIMTETDLALLNALNLAYSSKQDGKWYVKKAEKDSRDWMPKKLFTVKREGDHVHVYRTMADWRINGRRTDEIKYYKDDRPGVVDETKVSKSTARIHEWYLRNPNTLQEGSSIPNAFSKYLDAMKSIAIKNSRQSKDGGTFDVSAETDIINRYNKFNPTGIKYEGTGYDNDPDRELARKISFKGFWDEVNKQSSRIEKDVSQSTPEGQSKSTEGRSRIKFGEPRPYSEGSESKS